MINPFRIEFPFYQPFSVLMLDDDEDFLWSMRRALSNEHAILGYTSPTQALQKLKLLKQQAAFYFYPFSRIEDRESDSDEQLMVLQASTIDQLRTSYSRYDLISVVIVDEDMPYMTGLDFCRELKGSGIKTILLTGRMADPQQTIDAFNAGIIDRFVSKGDVKALDKIKAAISELQLEYFSDNSAALNKLILPSIQHKLSETELVHILEQAFECFPFTEYYYHFESKVYILRNDVGETKICLFAHQSTLNDVALFLAEQDATSILVKNLKDGTHIVPWQLLNDSYEAKDISFQAKKIGNTCWCLRDPEELKSVINLAQAADTISWQTYKANLLLQPLNSETAV